MEYDAGTWTPEDVEKWAELRFPFAKELVKALHACKEKEGVEVSGKVLLQMDADAVKSLALSPMQAAAVSAGIEELKRSYMCGSAPRPEFQRIVVPAHDIKEVVVDGRTLTLERVVAVGKYGANVSLHEDCKAEMLRSRRTVEKFVEEDRVVYGVTTGFGALANKRIPTSKAKQLQVNLIESHAAGVGEPFPREVVRAAMLLRANSLVQGLSGVRIDVVNQLLAFLNNDIVPIVPKHGSVGCSGDLAPLSHITRCLMGRGWVWHKGEKRETEAVLKELGLEPLVLLEKEGLALINGTQIVAALLTFALHDAYRSLYWAIVTASMAVEALRCSHVPFDPRIHAARGHPGQITVAAAFREYFADSEIHSSHQGCTCDKVQDAYSIRTSPQVLGAVKDTLDHALRVLEIELNAVTDNPIIDGYANIALQSGNFHAEPLAFVSDFIAIAIVDLGNMVERRIDRLVNPLVSGGLPPFLCAGGSDGLNSGYMIWQYTAAALASENKTAAFPASADSIPTSAYQEDHVSMGPIAARKAYRIIHNFEKIVAIEAMLSARALEFLRPLRVGRKLQPLVDRIQAALKPVEGDRFFGDEYEDVLAVLKAVFPCEV